MCIKYEVLEGCANIQSDKTLSHYDLYLSGSFDNYDQAKKLFDESKKMVFLVGVVTA